MSSLKGWNWGNFDFEETSLRFRVDNQHSFEIPYSYLQQSSTTASKNEVTLAMKGETDSKDEEILTEMRIYVPQDEDSKGNLVEEFYKNIQERSDIGSKQDGVAIVKFDNLFFSVPRGRYSITFYPEILHLHGKTFGYRIPYKHVSIMFLFDADQNHQILVLGLDPAPRQGRTSYPYLLLQFKSEETTSVQLELDSKEIKEKYSETLPANGKLTGPLYKVVVQLLNAFTGKRPKVPAEEYRSAQQTTSFRCSYKANTGALYVLKKSFFFIRKPPTHIRHADITNIEFQRLDNENAGTGRMFDLQINCKNNLVYKFTSIDREELSNLFKFMQENSLTVASSKAVAKFVASGGRRTNYNEDSFLPPIDSDDEDEEGSSEDEDFEAASESEDSAEFDTDEGDDDDAEDQAAAAPTKKRKKPEESEKKKTKKKSSVKKAKTAFLFFSQANRAKLKEENASLTFGELGKLLGEKWNALSSEEKKPYEEQAEQDKQRAEQERKKEAQEKKDKGEESSDSGEEKKKPVKKRGKNAYAFFVAEKSKEIKQANPSMSFAEVSKKVSEEWKQLSVEQKKPYFDKAEADKARVEKEQQEEEDAEDEDNEADNEKKKKKKKKKSRDKEKKHKRSKRDGDEDDEKRKERRERRKREKEKNKDKSKDETDEKTNDDSNKDKDKDHKENGDAAMDDNDDTDKNKAESADE